MNARVSVQQLGRLILTRHLLLAEGYTDKRIYRRVERGELLRLSRGIYVEEQVWRALDATDRHLTMMLARDQAAVNPPVFSHMSAALLLNLPLFNADLTKSHILHAAGARRSHHTYVAHHHAEIDSAEIVQVAGLMCTDPIRTSIDLARTYGFEAGLVSADAMLRRARLSTGQGSNELRAQMLDRLGRLPFSNGSRRARRVLEFASAHAESPLESLSRLQLVRLGFQVAEQVRVAAPDGGEYRLDFELEGQNTFHEVDGRTKYLDAAMRNGLTAEQVVYEEKQREDWVRGTTGYRLTRSAWAQGLTPNAMARHLVAFGIQPPNWPLRRHTPELY